MNKEELKIYLAKNFPDCKVEDVFDFPLAVVEKKDILVVAKKLKEDSESLFDFLFCQTAIDQKTHFEVVYHISSSTYRHNLELKVKLDHGEMPELLSVASLWKAAELYECEIYDLMGIRFLEHPSLRRLFLPDSWAGYPLRKDYKDDVNVLTL